MAEICPVCKEKIEAEYKEEIQGVSIHNYCEPLFLSEPEKFGGKKSETVEEVEATNQPTFAGDFLEVMKEKTSEESEEQRIEEHSKLQKEINDKSVYVKGFSMPFGEMVEFMVKWAIASIPAFIILFIIFGIFFAIFGALFF